MKRINIRKNFTKIELTCKRNFCFVKVISSLLFSVQFVQIEVSDKKQNSLKIGSTVKLVYKEH